MTPDELARRIAEIAVLHGTFTLRSGRTSSYYIDKYLFLTEPSILQPLGAMIAARLPEGTNRLAGAELGAVRQWTYFGFHCGNRLCRHFLLVLFAHRIEAHPALPPRDHEIFSRSKVRHRGLGGSRVKTFRQ